MPQEKEISGQRRELLTLLARSERATRGCLAAAAADGLACRRTLQAAQAKAARLEGRIAAAEQEAEQRGTQLALTLEAAVVLREEVQQGAEREASAAAVHTSQVSITSLRRGVCNLFFFWGSCRRRDSDPAPDPYPDPAPRPDAGSDPDIILTGFPHKTLRHGRLQI